MALHHFTPVLGKRIRVTPCNACGVVEDGAESVVTDGFITVGLSAEVEDGTEIVQKNASGNICVNELGNPSFKRFNVEMEMCGVNPRLVTATTNAEIYTDGDDEIGFTVPEGEMDSYFVFEIWTGLTGAQGSCSEGGDEASGYMLLPIVAGGTLGDITIDGENAVTFSLANAATRGGNQWGTGLFEVVKTAEGTSAKLPEPIDPLDHLLIIDTALTPPPVASEPVPVPAGE